MITILFALNFGKMRVKKSQKRSQVKLKKINQKNLHEKEPDPLLISSLHQPLYKKVSVESSTNVHVLGVYCYVCEFQSIMKISSFFVLFALFLLVFRLLGLNSSDLPTIMYTICSYGWLNGDSQSFRRVPCRAHV